MASKPQNVSERISALFEKRAKRFKIASLLVRIAFVAIATAVATAAQLLQATENEFTKTQVIGLAATFIALGGSLFVIFTEEDASEELSVARRVSEDLRDAIEGLHSLPDFQEGMERYNALYRSAIVMRSALETGVIARDSIRKIIENLTNLTDRILPVALGFAQSDRWTICVYRAEESDSGRDRLTCISHNRAIKCDISKARNWEEGVGVVGIAYANRQEIVVPNMHLAGLGTVFNIAAGARDYDSDRYRSIAAVPIWVDGRAKPWGVVVATNDRFDHFGLDVDAGPPHVEGARLLSSMAALAVVVGEDDFTSSSDEALTSTPDADSNLIQPGESQ